VFFEYGPSMTEFVGAKTVMSLRPLIKSMMLGNVESSAANAVRLFAFKISTIPWPKEGLTRRRDETAIESTDFIVMNTIKIK